MTDMPKHASKRNRKRFLFAIAIPAAVEVWTCWAGLGSLCGFPVIALFRLHLSTNWTLATGMEAYGVYALHVWLNTAPGERSRKVAQYSSLGAFILSLIGQVAYHLMLAGNVKKAPAVVVIFVACLPVAILAFAAILTHLMHADERAAADAAEEAALGAALEQERSARLLAEAERDTARVEAVRAAAEEAARPAAPEQPPGRHKGGTPRRQAAQSRGGTPEDSDGDKVVKRAEAIAILAAEPGISGSELGRRLGVQPGYGRKLKRELAPAQGGGN